MRDLEFWYTLLSLSMHGLLSIIMTQTQDPSIRASSESHYECNPGLTKQEVKSLLEGIWILSS